jgi:hypothetical protein
MVTLIDDDVTICRNAVLDGALANEALEHRHVKPAGGPAAATPDPPDLGRRHAEEERELRHPLFEERLAVNEDEGAATASRGQEGTDHRLPEARRSHENAKVVGEKGLGGLLLEGCELAPEAAVDSLASLALVFDHQPNPVLRQQTGEIFLTAAG